MISANKIIHKNIERIEIIFDYNPEISFKIKKIKDSRWSETYKAWHIPYTKEAFKKLKELFPNIQIPDSQKREDFENIERHITNFKKWLEHKRYSNSTINIYTDAVKVFLKFVLPKKVSDVEAYDMVRFVNEYIIPHNYSYSYQN